jgi:hypothetical protein
MLGQMTDAQAITLFAVTAGAILGIVGDYITTEVVIGKGGSEGNPFVLKIMKALHIGLPVFTFLTVVALLFGVVAPLATVIGGWWPSIPPAAVVVSRLIQIKKNLALSKSMTAKPANGSAPAPIAPPPTKK